MILVKLSDVSRLAQVSETTVSRVLNGDTTFSTSDATRRRIYVAVPELGHIPNRLRKARPAEEQPHVQALAC